MVVMKAWTGIVVVAVGTAAAGWRVVGTHSSESVSAQAGGRWELLGPTSLVHSRDTSASDYQSGRIYSIAVDPRDPSHWLLGVGNGGVWDSRDAGGSWRPITDDAPTLATGAIAFAPSDPNIVYVGTGESHGGLGFAHVGVGLLKSNNGGQSWALLAQSDFARASVKRIRIDPNNASLLVAATSRAGFGRDSHEGAPATPPVGILRSTDGGNSWTRTLAGQATALEIDPSNFGRQYAAIADQRLGIVGFEDRTATANGLYRSSDGGMSWSRIEGPWGREPSSVRSAVGRVELAIAPSNANVMYASIQVPPNGGSSSTGLLGLFRTDNAWAEVPNWVEVPTQATGPGGYCTPKCGYTHVISVDPRDANTMFGGGAELGFWRCNNCGTSPTWTDVARAGRFIHSDYHALAWAGNRLIVGNDGGVWSTPDFGASWQNHNRTLTTTMFFMGDLHPRDSSLVLAGLRDFPLTVFRPSSGWRVLPQANISEWGEGEVAISSAHPDTDWMVTWINGVIQRTTDGGRTSVQVDGGIDKAASAFVPPVRKCPSNDDVVLAATLRIWRTNNFFSSNLPSWAPNSPGHQFPMPGFSALDYPWTIHSIGFVEADRSCTTYAYGNRGGEVQLTKDGGATWTNLDPSRALPARPINSLAFDPANANRAFAAVSSYDEATPTKPGHIFRSDNALSTSPSWTRVGPPDVPFANMPFNVIAIDPRDTRLVYAGSDNGLWQSTDGGNSWTKVGRESGLPPASVYDIKIIPATNRTVVFTYGRGAFELVR